MDHEARLFSGLEETSDFSTPLPNFSVLETRPHGKHFFMLSTSPSSYITCEDLAKKLSNGTSLAPIGGYCKRGSGSPDFLARWL